LTKAESRKYIARSKKYTVWMRESDPELVRSVQ
jgi:hypothetical protein